MNRNIELELLTNFGQVVNENKRIDHTIRGAIDYESGLCSF